jgi:hypothetical protein
LSLTFQIEPLEKCWNEAMVLAHQHWEETEMYRGQAFSPSFQRYQAYEKGGWFIGFTGRDGEKLGAYAGIYVVPDMHTQEVLATEDAFFMAKEYRGGRNFLRFYQFIEAEIARRGAKRIMFTAPQTNGTGRLLERLDYQPVSVQYSKSLARADSASEFNAVMESADA